MPWENKKVYIFSSKTQIIGRHA